MSVKPGRTGAAPHPVQVVRAVPEDASTVARLLHDFNVEFAAPTPTHAELTSRFAGLLERDDVLALLARSDDSDVGLALVTWRPSPYHAGGVAMLDELYVRPPLRDRGIGTALVRGMFDWVGERGIGEVHINVDEVDVDTRRFYERHGFTNLEVTALSTSRMLMYVRELPTSERDGRGGE